ncbi:putative membrane protein [Anoxybacillus calidus]|uniref:Putative membrane protein n=1 Tax=[Anoxybacillus] calidus TaxID=575178 RepID=A0A7V9Z107_9BACL|nr:YhgE/Pip domain-containing protein [Anoxybacillus calidus]MBA2871932.1 putative membrane protein [Anoxybacillus calidus]
MNGIKLIFKDWKLLLSNKHGRIALGFLLIVPLIYVGFFLSGYWDPYSRLEQLPVAVVNLDKGAVMDNQAIYAGDDFVKKLKENKDLNFRFVSSKEAEDGLKDGRYYMTITIPEDFSKKVTTLMDKHPQPAQLVYKINPGKNFVASQISSTAVKEMKTKMANSITKSYTEGVFHKMQELAKGLDKAADGARKLNEGTSEAKNGMARLTEGLGKAADGVRKLNEGTSEVKNGMVQLTNGINRLTNGATQLQQGSNRLSLGAQKLDQGLQRLKQGTTDLSSGMSQLSIGHQKLENGMDQLTQGTKAWADGSVKIEQGQAQLEETANVLKAALEQYVQKHPDAVQDADMQKIIKISEGIAVATNTLHNGQTQLVEGAKKLNAAQGKIEEGMKQFGVKMSQATEGAKQLSVGAAQLANGFSQWENGFFSLSKGITALANGEQQLHNGAEKLSNGLTRLTDGMSELSTKEQQLYNGAEKLSNGLIQLTDGTSELSTKLNEAAQKTSTIHTSDAVTTMFSQPVKLVESKLTDVPNYGSGIAPYFLSLGLYVGGIMGANILPLVRREEISGTAHFINKLGLFYSIGLIQTAIVDTLILCVFKLHVTSIPLFILFSLLVSLTFMTFILMLATVFGLVGKFAAITLLILQLATCGGTFPMELNAPIMRSIGQCLPMTYSLRGFQDVISLGDWSQLQQQTLILLSYLVGAALIIWVTCLIQNRKSPTAPVH